MSAYLPWLTSVLDDWLGGADVKAMLLGPTFTVDQLAEFRVDILAEEVAGTGYTAGGVAVTGLTVTQVDADLNVSVDFTDVDFGTIDIDDIVAIALYLDVGTSATDVLIGFDTFTASTTGGANFTYRPHVDGFLLAASP